MAYIKGRVYWCKHNKLDEMSGKYQIDVTLDETGRSTVVDLGLDKYIKNKDDERGDFITLKSKRPIKAVDINKVELPANKEIGNGSVVKAIVRPYTSPGFKGLFAGASSLMVLELKEFSSDGVDEFGDDNEGYALETSDPSLFEDDEFDEVG